MSKKNAAGWAFHEHESDGVIGQKRFDEGVTLREVHGKDLAEAQGLADVIDNQVAQRENGQIELNSRAANELRAQAKALEGK